MNATIAWATVRERLTGVVNLALTALLIAMPSVTAHDRLTDASSFTGQLGLTLVVAIGSIGRELAAGTLALVFCRPIRRADYVLTKWVTLSLMALAWGVAQLSTQWAVCALLDNHVPLASVAQNLFERVTVSFGLVAVLLSLSILARGPFDVVMWFIVYTVAALASAFDYPWLDAVGKELRFLLVPEIHYWHTFHSQPIVWSAVFAYGSAVGLWLALACWLLARKELSYAA